jgi:putative flippase GtrA
MAGDNEHGKVGSSVDFLRLINPVHVRSRAQAGSVLAQGISFASVGVVAGLADYALMISLRELLETDAVLAALAGYVLGSFVSYVLNRINTFKSSRSHSQALWRFLTVNVVGFSLTALLMSFLVNDFGVHYVYARAATTALVFVLNFTSHRFWTFTSRVTRP